MNDINDTRPNEGIIIVSMGDRLVDNQVVYKGHASVCWESHLMHHMLADHDWIFGTQEQEQETTAEVGKLKPGEAIHVPFELFSVPGGYWVTFERVR